MKHGTARTNLAKKKLAWRKQALRDLQLPHATISDLEMIAQIYASAPDTSSTSGSSLIPGHDVLFGLEDHETEIKKLQPNLYKQLCVTARLAIEKKIVPDSKQAVTEKGSEGVDVEESHIIKLLCKFHCNNFGIVNHLIVAQGAGCYPFGALLNHSCAPNCVLMYDVDPQRGHCRQIIRSIEYIKEGEEITHSYVDGIFGRSERQAQLSATYFFTCECPRCEREASNSTKLLFGKECLVEWLVRQAKIHANQSQELLQLHHALVALLLEERNGLWDAQIIKYINNLLDECLVLGLLEQSATLLTWLLRGYENLYPTNHPLKGLQWYLLGDVLSELASKGMLQFQSVGMLDKGEASDNLNLTQLDIKDTMTKAHKKAKSILAISHGEHHDLVTMQDH
eukprot:m.102834 g.102834  ORF g.102834 m.102834 type:complete len:396 (+) comp13787_c0_seq6:531-1718(+)